MPTSADLIHDPIAAYPPATVACFDATRGDLPRRRLDHGRNIAFLEKLAGAGVPAVLIAASTGHGHLRTVDELDEWLTCSAEAELGATMKMALLRPEDGLLANMRLLDRVVELDYPVVFFRPGTDLEPDADDAEVARSLRPLIKEAAQRGLAVGLYSIPDVSGFPLSPQAAAMVVESEAGDSVVAIKVTEASYDTSTRLFLEHPALTKLKVVQGWDPHLAQALKDGPRYDAQGRQRCGVTSGPMSLAVHQYLHILSEAEKQNWNEVASSQQAVTALFASMQDDPTKFADLQRAKAIMGLGHPLMDAVSDEQVERVFVALQSLPRESDRQRLAKSLDLMGDGPCHERLSSLYDSVASP